MSVTPNTKANNNALRHRPFITGILRIPVKLPWIFPEAQLKANGALGIIQVNLTCMHRWLVTGGFPSEKFRYE